MSEITQAQAIQAALAEVVGAEAAEKVATLKGKELEKVYYLVAEQTAYHDVLTEEITVKSVLKELYELTEADFSKELSLSDLQDLMFQEVDMLAGLLGIELE